MSRNVRSIALALLLVLVAAPAAQALPLSERAGSGLVNRMLSWIEALLSPEVPGLTPSIEQAGSSMDPNGDPQNNNWITPTTDAGSSMDPNGGQ